MFERNSQFTIYVSESIDLPNTIRLQMFCAFTYTCPWCHLSRFSNGIKKSPNCTPYRNGCVSQNLHKTKKKTRRKRRWKSTHNGAATTTAKWRKIEAEHTEWNTHRTEPNPNVREREYIATWSLKTLHINSIVVTALNSFANMRALTRSPARYVYRNGSNREHNWATVHAPGMPPFSAQSIAHVHISILLIHLYALTIAIVCIPFESIATQFVSYFTFFPFACFLGSISIKCIHILSPAHTNYVVVCSFDYLWK